MAGLTGLKIKNTYGDLLQLNNSGAGITAALQTVKDGLGASTGLQISTLGTAFTLAVVGSGDGTNSLTAGTVRGPAAVGADIAGVNTTIAGSVSTGTGLGGSLIFQVANKGSTGSTANALGTALTLAPPNSGTTAIVNGVTITSAITTGTPTIAATGSDTNISLSLAPKGTGQIQIPSGTVSNVGLRFGLGVMTGIYENATILTLVAGGVAIAWLHGGTGETVFNQSYQMGFGSPIGNLDAGFKRVTAGVVQSIGASSVAGWFQNTAGRARVTADVTNITTTFASLSNLSLTLIAGRKYTGRLVIIVNEALAADGFKLDLNGGSATMTSIEFGFSSAIGATLGTRTSAALGTPITLTALLDTADVIIEIPVVLVCNAAGTIIPRQAKNGDAAGGTMTTRLGSYFWLEDMTN